LQAHCGERLENDSSGSQVTDEEGNYFSISKPLKISIYIFLYLKAFLYLFILQKGTVNPSAAQFAVSRFSEAIEMFQWCFVVFFYIIIMRFLFVAWRYQKYCGQIVLFSMI